METPRCKECGQFMCSIADIGGIVQMCDSEGKVMGVRSKHLYQCLEHKTVAVD